MKKVRKRDPAAELEEELRAGRPEPPGELVRTLTARVGGEARRSWLLAYSKLAFAAAVTVLPVGALASSGGIGYAASGTAGLVKGAARAVTPTGPRVVERSAAQDQYGPERITICHRTASGRRVTITISASALPAHRAHGDTVGPCPPGTGGVAGAGGGRSGGTGGPGSGVGGVPHSGALPFTGLSLAGTALASLLLAGAGIVLRRRADGGRPR